MVRLVYGNGYDVDCVQPDRVVPGFWWALPYEALSNGEVAVANSPVIVRVTGDPPFLRCIPLNGDLAFKTFYFLSAIEGPPTYRLRVKP